MSMHLPRIQAEDLLLRSGRMIDPFNRMGCNIDPTLTVIEFCQFQGPRPLANVSLKPNNALSSLDFDSLSLWLMSSEVTCGTILNVYNQQMGIYAFSYYTILYDIKARAFQRPICVALLSSNRPTSYQLSRFSNGVRKLVSPLVECNRRYFFRQIDDFISISDSIECQTSESCYTLDIEGLKQSLSIHKLMNLIEQARKIRSQMQAINEKLSDPRTYMECSGHKEGDRVVAEKSFNLISRTSALSHISDLAPCSYNTFIMSLNGFLNECCTENQMREGVLYCVNTPILRFPKQNSPIQISTFKSDENDSANKEETLRMVSQHLDNLLLPVLTGEDMIVCGSEQRKGTVVDFVEKINLLKPKSHPNHNVVVWTENENRPKGVIGICHNRSETAALNLPGIAILDTNSSVLRTVPYRGVLLTNLRQKRRFPSDAALLAFIAATLTNISSLVYVSRFLSPLHLETEKISFDDQRILVNFLTELDFIKYQGLKSALEKTQSKNVLMKTIKL